jgi:hypothetical protein
VDAVRRSCFGVTTRTQEFASFEPLDLEYGVSALVAFCRHDPPSVIHEPQPEDRPESC